MSEKISFSKIAMPFGALIIYCFLFSSLAAQTGTFIAPGFWKQTVLTDSGDSITVVIPRQSYTFTPTGSGRTLYVALTGNNSNNGSLNSPWETITYAETQLLPGDVLFIRGGEYPTPFKITKSGIAGQPIVISAYPGEKVHVFQPVGWQALNINAGTIILQGTSHVWLHGLEIEGCRGQAQAPAADHYGQNAVSLHNASGIGVRILNNVLFHAQHCGFKDIAGNTQFLVEGNIVYDNGITSLDHGLYCPSTHAVLRGNATFNNASWGFHFYSSPTGMYVYNNISFNNGHGGTIYSGPSNVDAHNVFVNNISGGIWWFRNGCNGNKFLNDILFKNSGTQISWDQGGSMNLQPTNNLLDYLVIFPQTSPAWYNNNQIPVQSGSNLIFQDPLFVEMDTVGVTDVFDLRLQSTSPVKGTAGAVSLNGGPSSPWPDPGLFPGTLYTDPTWPFSPTGIASVNDGGLNVNIYPHPNNGTFTIESATEGVYSIINELGQAIQTIKLNAGNNYMLSTQNLNNGMYFIVGYNNDQMIKQKVMVVK